jgi:hypothetical protein
VPGRPLHEDEEVSVTAFSSHDAARGDARQAAVSQLQERIKKTARHTKDLPDEQGEEGIEEALAYVRSHSR